MLLRTLALVSLLAASSCGAPLLVSAPHADLLQDRYAEPQFAVVFDNTPVPVTRVKEDDPFQMVMSSKGVEHLCFLPQPVATEPGTADQRADGFGSVLDLLKPLEGICLHKNLGWWSYAVCVGETVTQYHEEQKAVISQHSLGSRLVPNEQDPNELALQEGYVLQRFAGGTICDLTGKERETEVRYYCNPDALEQIEFIRETSTCQYLIRVITPRLCSHPAFSSQQKGQVSNILCHPLVSEERFREMVVSLDSKLFTRAPQVPSAKAILGEVFKKAKVAHKAGTFPDHVEKILQNVSKMFQGSKASEPQLVVLSDEEAQQLLSQHGITIVTTTTAETADSQEPSQQETSESNSNEETKTEIVIEVGAVGAV